MTSKAQGRIKRKANKDVWVAVSGGFDPTHIGHVNLFKNARKLGDKLVVILNNDNWLMKKKGYVFMPEKERKKLLEAIRYVDRVVLTEHPKNPPYRHIGFTIRKVKPNIFCNGGDKGITNEFEVAACKAVGCKMVARVGGGKVQSSSWLVDNFEESLKHKLKKPRRW